MKNETIALACMAKNEVDVIERMLESVKPLIDRVVLLDTGSTDGTQALARKWCVYNELPFDLIEHPFDNFGASRTRLLQFSKGKADWIFMLDCDWTVDLEEDDEGIFLGSELIRERLDPAVASYSLLHGDAVKYYQPHFIRGDQDWEYIGPCHEYLRRSEASVPLHGLRVVQHDCDPAARTARTHRNLKLLLDDYAKDPKNLRTIFYLARTYNQLGLRDLARPLFQQRASMEGWPEETFSAACDAAYCRTPSDPIEFWEAWASRPTRAEPLFWLARVYHQRGEKAKSIAVNELRKTIPVPKGDILFVDTAAYGPDANPFT